MNTEQLVEVLLTMNAGMIDRVVDSMMPLVRGQNLETRKVFYEMGRVNCIKGGT